MGLVRAGDIFSEIQNKEKKWKKSGSKLGWILLLYLLLMPPITILLIKNLVWWTGLIFFIISTLFVFILLREIFTKILSLAPSKREFVVARLIKLAGHLKNYSGNIATNENELKLAKKQFKHLMKDLNSSIKSYDNIFVFDRNVESLLLMRACLNEKIISFFKKEKGALEANILGGSLEHLAVLVYDKKEDQVVSILGKPKKRHISSKEKISNFLFGSESVSFFFSFFLFFALLLGLFSWIDPFSDPSNLNVFISILVYLFALFTFKKVQGVIQKFIDFSTSLVTPLKEAKK